MAGRKKIMENEELQVELKIAGKQIPMVPFVQNALRDVIMAFVKNLKGHEGGKIEIVIE